MIKKKSRAEQIAEIRNRRSNFGRKMMEQRKAVQERLKAYRRNLDTGIPPTSDDRELPGVEEDSEDVDGKEFFEKKTKAVKLAALKKTAQVEDDEDLDDEDNEELPPIESKSIPEIVMGYYQEYRDQGMKSKSASVLTLASIIAELGLIIKNKN